MRVAHRVAALAVPVLATGCTVEGIDETGMPLPVTGEALAVLAGDHVDLRLESVWTPDRRADGCAGNARLVRADADFQGSHVDLTLEVGDCSGSEKVAFVCAGDRVPLGQEGEATALAGCEREELDGGRVLCTGTHAGHEGPTYRVAVLYDRGLRYTVASAEGDDVRGYELAEIAEDARVGATVDAAYVVAGQDLARSRDH